MRRTKANHELQVPELDWCHQALLMVYIARSRAMTPPQPTTKATHHKHQKTAPAPQKQKQGLICFKNNWLGHGGVYSWGRRKLDASMVLSMGSWKFWLSGICSPIQLLMIHSKIKTWETSKSCACIFICRLLIKIMTSNQLRVDNEIDSFI
jgi:hypothetical protein